MSQLSCLRSLTYFILSKTTCQNSFANPFLISGILLLKKGIIMEYTVEGTDTNFDQEVLKSDIPVLVDFWAPWCGPCRMVSPLVDELAEELIGKLKVVKVNTDENQEIAVKYGIRSIPTLGIFKNGEIVDGVIGDRKSTRLN